jgi:hypothetical protein
MTSWRPSSRLTDALAVCVRPKSNFPCAPRSSILAKPPAQPQEQEHRLSIPAADAVRSGPQSAPLAVDDLRKIDAHWRAANYLSVGQIYLFDNPLLRKPLTKEHIKPRLLGHWGTTPGLNFIYVHLNRVIKKNDLSMIYITGPGHGGPGLVANAYLGGRTARSIRTSAPMARG